MTSLNVARRYQYWVYEDDPAEPSSQSNLFGSGIRLHIVRNLICSITFPKFHWTMCIAMKYNKDTNVMLRSSIIENETREQILKYSSMCTELAIEIVIGCYFLGNLHISTALLMHNTSLTGVAARLNRQLNSNTLVMRLCGEISLKMGSWRQSPCWFSCENCCRCHEGELTLLLGSTTWIL